MCNNFQLFSTFPRGIFTTIIPVICYLLQNGADKFVDINMKSVLCLVLDISGQQGAMIIKAT